LDMQHILEKHLDLIYQFSQGKDKEEVKETPPPKSISTSMSLTPIDICNIHTSIRKVIGYIVLELNERLHEDSLLHEQVVNLDKVRRHPNNFTFKYRMVDGKEESVTWPVASIKKRGNDTDLSEDEMVDICIRFLRSKVLGTTITESFDANTDKIKLKNNKMQLRWIQVSFGSFIYPKQNSAILQSFAKSTAVVEKLIPSTNEESHVKEQISLPEVHVDDEYQSVEKVKCIICGRECFPSLIDVHVNSHFESKPRGTKTSRSEKTLMSYFSPIKKKKQ